jgi:hypothetical protein
MRVLGLMNLNIRQRHSASRDRLALINMADEFVSHSLNDENQ